MRFVETTRFRRGKLPHWEIAGGRYFVTLRLADSLPRPAILRLQEIHTALAGIEAASQPFATLQRQYFLTMEKYLDSGAGSCALSIPSVATALAVEFHKLSEWRIGVPHFSIMPNHCHALLVPDKTCTHSLADAMKRFKGRTAQLIRLHTTHSGAVWQREWFDRWLRSDAEYEKVVAYIRNNPVKAGLAKTWTDHPWTQ